MIETLLKYANIANLVGCLALLMLMWRRRQIAEFRWLTAFLAVEGLEQAICIPILFFRQYLNLSRALAYPIYFYTRWICGAVEAALLIWIIYSIFTLAMRPLEGLHRIGKIIFHWVACVSIALSLAFAFAPHIGSLAYFGTFVAQMQQGISVLTLCLLLFVCFAIRPLGLTYRSHIFGISLGLGVFATSNLVQAAWYNASSAHSVYSAVYLVSAFGGCASFAIWATYFLLPEPERKMILLPTTSPFFLWNSISEALGDEPGFVAVAGFTPDMLAPAELKVLTAASELAREREARELQELHAPNSLAVNPMHSIALQR